VAIAGLVTSVLAAAVFHQYRRKRQTERELDKLRDLTRAKDQFLASVSHELRTPLTGVLGFAELLRSDHEDLSEDERRSMLASVAGQATDLAAIIDDLLVAARSELDLLAITRVPVSFRAQLAQVVETTDRSLRDRIEVVGDNVGSAMGDPGRVRQIIRNLVTNADRYGGDQIEVRFKEVGGMVRLEVADNGTGLDSEESERVFEPYYRVDQKSSTQPAALGIGLSVARHLARLMEGDVIYRRAGEWSVFCLSLPLAPAGIRPEQEHSVAIII
jgi:signal transduction histidine kinase